jgi:hypothetical protein
MKVGPSIFSRLIALRGIGPNVANILQAEILGRRFANRREIAQYARFRCVRWPQASSGPFSSDQAARPKAWWTKARCAGMSSLGTTRTCPLILQPSRYGLEDFWTITDSSHTGLGSSLAYTAAETPT